MPSSENRYLEDNQIQPYRSVANNYGSRDLAGLQDKATFLNSITYICNAMGLLGEVSDGHGEYLSGCASYKTPGYSLCRVNRFKGRRLSATPLSEVFDSVDLLIDYLSTISPVLIDEDNNFTIEGEKVWNLFQRSKSDIRSIIARIGKFDVEIWNGWCED